MQLAFSHIELNPNIHTVLVRLPMRKLLKSLKMQILLIMRCDNEFSFHIASHSSGAPTPTDLNETAFGAERPPSSYPHRHEATAVRWIFISRSRLCLPPRMCFISIRSHGMHPESGRLHRELVMNSLSAKLEYYRDKTEGNAPKKNRILTSQQTHPRPKEKSSSLSRERHSSGKSTRFLFGSAHFCLSC